MKIRENIKEVKEQVESKYKSKRVQSQPKKDEKEGKKTSFVQNLIVQEKYKR